MRGIAARNSTNEGSKRGFPPDDRLAASFGVRWGGGIEENLR